MSRRQRNLERFWAEKVKAARTPEDAAAVAWDRVRAAVVDLPKESRAGVWAAVAARLDALRVTVTDSEFTSAVHTELRTGARPNA